MHQFSFATLTSSPVRSDCYSVPTGWSYPEPAELLNPDWTRITYFTRRFAKADLREFRFPSKFIRRSESFRLRQQHNRSCDADHPFFKYGVFQKYRCRESSITMGGAITSLSSMTESILRTSINPWRSFIACGFSARYFQRFSSSPCELAIQIRHQGRFIWFISS